MAFSLGRRDGGLKPKVSQRRSMLGPNCSAMPMNSKPACGLQARMSGDLRKWY
jgi:hypothetical protein